MYQKTVQTIRWVARILAALMAAFIAFMFIGNAVSDGIGPFLGMNLRESLMMTVFLIVFLGLILGWRMQKLGGWLAVGGMAAFYLLDFTFSGNFPRGPFFPLIALPGLLFLVAGYSQKTAQEESGDNQVVR